MGERSSEAPWDLHCPIHCHVWLRPRHSKVISRYSKLNFSSSVSLGAFRGPDRERLPRFDQREGGLRRWGPDREGDRPTAESQSKACSLACVMLGQFLSTGRSLFPASCSQVARSLVRGRILAKRCGQRTKAQSLESTLR